MKRVFILFALFALALGPAARAGDLEDLKATFERAVKALNDRNLDGFLSAVHEKSLSFYACGPTSGLEGRAACQQDWQKFFTKTTAVFTPRNFQYRVIGSTGIAWGEYTVAEKTKSGKEMTLEGRYTLIFTKEQGKWMIVFQENTPNLPAGARPVTTGS